jgi:predicted transcriptional regulator
MTKEEISTQPDEGAELRKMREQVGMTQTDLAKRAGVSLNLISMLEAGHRNFTNRSREKIYRVLVEVEQASRKAPSVLTTLGALAKANPAIAESAWSPLSSFEFMQKNFGIEKTVELQKSLIDGLQKENELLKLSLADWKDELEDWRKMAETFSEESRQWRVMAGRLIDLLNIETEKGLLSVEAQEKREDITADLKAMATNPLTVEGMKSENKKADEGGE